MAPRPHLWQRAASYSARAHRHQMRKDGSTPFAAHPFRVAMTVRHVFECDDEVAIAAALLHDTIEDTGADYDEIRDHFGAEVADCVAALTKNMILPEAEREAEYDQRLSRADWRARLVKLADVYDNLTDALDRSPEAARKAKEKCRRALHLARDDAHPALQRAVRIVGELVQSSP